MSDVGIYHFVTGEPGERDLLERCRASLTAHHPDVPVREVPLRAGDRGTQQAAMMARELRASPFEVTVVLAPTVVVLQPLDFAIERARRFGLAMTLAPNPWAYPEGPTGRQDEVQYDSDVLLVTRKAAPVLGQVQKDLIRSRAEGLHPFGAFKVALTYAIHALDFLPYTLPINWNWKSLHYTEFYGPMMVWNSVNPVPEKIRDLMDYYGQPDSVIQYHPFEMDNYRWQKQFTWKRG